MNVPVVSSCLLWALTDTVNKDKRAIGKKHLNDQWFPVVNSKL